MIYYCIISNEQFNNPIPDAIRDYMGYPENYLLKDCVFGEPKQTIDEFWLCDCRLRTYYNSEVLQDGNVIVSKIGISNNCTNRELYPHEVEIWKQYVGENNVFTDVSNIILKPIKEEQS